MFMHKKSLLLSVSLFLLLGGIVWGALAIHHDLEDFIAIDNAIHIEFQLIQNEEFEKDFKKFDDGVIPIETYLEKIKLAEPWTADIIGDFDFIITKNGLKATSQIIRKRDNRCLREDLWSLESETTP